MTTAAVYLRVSTDDQASGDAVSLDAQRDLCRKYAASHGFTVTGEYVDAGESAFKQDHQRPAFERLLADAQAGRFENVIVWKADRFSRRAADAFPLLARLERCHVKLHSTQEDLTNWLLSAITFVVAENESRNTSARVKAALQDRVEQGLWPHSSTSSWGVIPQPDRTVRFDPLIAPVITEAFRRSLAGASSGSITHWLRHELGYRKSKGSVFRILRNPIYAGLIRWKGNTYEGQHEGLVDKETFFAVQERLSRNRRPGPSGVSEFAIAGLVYCAICGSSMRIARTKKRLVNEIKPYAYFRCEGGHSDGSPAMYVSAAALDAYVSDDVRQRFLAEDAISLLEEWVREGMASVDNATTNQRSALTRQKERLQTQLDRAFDLLVQGTIAPEVYQPQEARLRSAIAVLEKELAGVDESTVRPAKGENLVRQLHRLPEVLSNSAPAILNPYLRLLIERIDVAGKRPTGWSIAYFGAESSRVGLEGNPTTTIREQLQTLLDLSATI